MAGSLRLQVMYYVSK